MGIMKKMSKQLEALYNKICSLAQHMNYVIEEAYKIKNYCPDEDDDEDEEPAAYCDNCGEAIWDVDKIVYGVDGKYCCDECCREDEGAGEEEDEDEIEDEDEEPLTWCDNCGKMIWSEYKFVDGLGGKYCCEECKVQGQRKRGRG